ncbi:hypothetical protein [Actinomadura sp. WAC 06369]|uniref:hypothetical protein n=1 Tax=Actinomadura sp. WAC 06369 TaxID=2203193 RepID=UPI000F78EC70|nr:hypothetical protein [Actinomadura sp. WAC 06369]RSN41038.1 hypothetical protein DMH08_39145 [Actinomadura sp. WAC 06369]
MEFKIDTAGRSFIVADQPEQRVDFETKAPRTNTEGVPLFSVRLLVMDGTGSAPIKVGLVGDPGIGQGLAVRPVGLALNVIERRGDVVTWWTAERLEPGPLAGGGAADGAGGGSGSGRSGRSGKDGE